MEKKKHYRTLIYGRKKDKIHTSIYLPLKHMAFVKTVSAAKGLSMNDYLLNLIENAMLKFADFED